MVMFLIIFLHDPDSCEPNTGISFCLFTPWQMMKIIEKAKLHFCAPIL